MKRRDLNCALKYFLLAIIIASACLTFTTHVYVVLWVYPSSSGIERYPEAQRLERFVPGVTWEKFSYNRTRFFASINGWRSRQRQGQLHCLVLIPPRSSSVISWAEELIGTISAALSSPSGQVVVHIRKHDVDAVSSIAFTFSKYLANNQLILLVSDYESFVFDSDDATSDLRDGLELAYMLDLSHQSESNFSMVLWPGWQLRKSFFSFDYVKDSIHHYQEIDELRKSANDFNRTCWTVLSDEGVKRGDEVLFEDTHEHALRMVKFLRSTLPYKQKKYPELLDIYCKHFIWSGNTIAGPSLFEFPAPKLQAQTVRTTSNSEKPIVGKSLFAAPPWIDQATTFGPQKVDADPSYLIAFGVTAMIRPIVNATYLERFLNSLLQILTTTFSLPGNVTGGNRCNATIVVLLSGNTLQEITQLRGLLETNFMDAIERHMLRLVDSPIETFLPLLENRRSTYNESTRRRTWRSKQNLDVGALFQAASGLSEYVMLLEDDTGFQPKFAEKLMSKLQEDKASSSISWAQTDFGFGYSGILIRAMDAPVYQQLHQTFFDEIPCDLLGNWRVVQNGKRVYVYSPASLRYSKRLYLKHLGKQSSLVGKTQIVW